MKVPVFEILKEDVETIPYVLPQQQETELAIALEETYHEEN